MISSRSRTRVEAEVVHDKLRVVVNLMLRVRVTFFEVLELKPRIGWLITLD